jgi:hypothetical protein
MRALFSSIDRAYPYLVAAWGCALIALWLIGLYTYIGFALKNPHLALRISLKLSYSLFLMSSYFDYLRQSGHRWVIYYCACIVASLPVLVLYPYVSPTFCESVTCPVQAQHITGRGKRSQ